MIKNRVEMNNLNLSNGYYHLKCVGTLKPNVFKMKDVYGNEVFVNSVNDMEFMNCYVIKRDDLKSGILVIYNTTKQEDLRVK